MFKNYYIKRVGNTALIFGTTFLLAIGFQNCSGFGSQLGHSLSSASSSSLSAGTAAVGIQSFSSIAFTNSTSYFNVANAQTGGFGYAYGPAIIYTQGVYHAYFCSGGTGQQTEWDDVRHATSTDLITWSTPDIVIRPVTLERSACDPSIVLYDAGDGAYYYLFYSGNITNVQTVNFVSRSKSPSGPFLKYTDRKTWEAAPADPHVIQWPFKAGAEGSSVYGAGEPSVVVHGGVLYMWYTNIDESGKPNGIYLTTSKDAVTWSSPVYTQVNSGSTDVKFDPASQLFVMTDLLSQISTSAALTMRTSPDGINWSAAQMICDTNCLPHYSSNPGMSGDDQGQLLVGKPTLIGFGAPYNISNPVETWGEWNLWGQLFNLTITNTASSSSATSSSTSGSSTSSSASTAIIPPGDVKGIVDAAVTNSDGTVSITGWACALYDPNSIQVALYLGPAGSTAGIGWFPASSASEPAIASQCQSTGTAYRFSISLSQALASQYAGQLVHVNGISPWGLPNYEIANPNSVHLPAAAVAPAATSTATTYPPVASNDVLGIFGVDANGVISGWACVTGISTSINVHFYVNGPAGIGTFAVATTANMSNESAVNQQCSANGSFRFQIAMDPSFRNAFRGQTIYIYGISSVGGANKLLANSGAVVVP